MSQLSIVWCWVGCALLCTAGCGDDGSNVGAPGLPSMSGGAGRSGAGDVIGTSGSNATGQGTSAVGAGDGGSSGSEVAGSGGTSSGGTGGAGGSADTMDGGAPDGPTIRVVGDGETTSTILRAQGPSCLS